MEDNGGGKINGIWQIVKLKEILQKWQSVTLTSRVNTHPDHMHGGIPPAVSGRLKNSTLMCDSDEDSCQGPELPPDVPKGYLAVYVGPELRRFIIPTSFLSDPLFEVLLEKAEEEFGFNHNGGLTIPCEIETFKYLLKCIEKKQKDQTDPDLNSGFEF
ncbi:Small auxin-up RNA [Dillenia turbinata]|uniref:Small auxin-up RNA n=1 Tax=Dillenia turbinata TaxID=194707 RepID=A0AAN8W4M5_9MAGN